MKSLRRPEVVLPTLALGLSLGLLGGCAQDDGRTAVADHPTRHTADAEATASSGSPSTTSPAAETTLALYFVGDTPQGPRLFREFRSVAGMAGGELSLRSLTGLEPLDPDYRSLVPAGSVSSVVHEDGRIVITLPDDAWVSPGSLSEDQGALAAQQVVFTVQAALQSRDPVEVRVEGSDEPTFLFGVDTDGGLAHDVADLAPVSVTSPEEGSSASGTLKASGVADTFEATVPWQILDSSGSKVLDGFATAQESMTLSPWSTSIDISSLPAGDYTFVASTDDPSDGEGAGPAKDTKDFTVS